MFLHKLIAAVIGLSSQLKGKMQNCQKTAYFDNGIFTALFTESTVLDGQYRVSDRGETSMF